MRDWGEVDTLIVDLPPGTGDVQLSLIQKHKPAGAMIVSTPQDLALIDATRAIDLFNQIDVPIIGLVENMAGYACPHCGEVSDPFGAGGARGGGGGDGPSPSSAASRSRSRSARHRTRATRRRPAARRRRSPSSISPASCCNG